MHFTRTFLFLCFLTLTACQTANPGTDRTEVSDPSFADMGSSMSLGEGWQPFRDEATGLSFSYPRKPRAFVAFEPPYSEEEILKYVYVMLLEHVEEEGRMEGPPSFALGVFTNPKNLSPEDWVKKNDRFSSYSLKTSETGNTAFKGHPAFRYRADALYATDVWAISANENIYFVTVGFIEENDQLHKDFLQILSTVELSEPSSASGNS